VPAPEKVTHPAGLVKLNVSVQKSFVKLKMVSEFEDI